MKPLFTSICTIAVFAACAQEPTPRENPLVQSDIASLSRWILTWGEDNSKTQHLDGCSTYWARAAADEIPAEGVNICSDLAKELATVLAESGYGSIQSNDVLLPPIWTGYQSARKIAEFTRPRLSPEEQAERDRARRALGIPTE